jgi:hypothetical protein
MGAMAALDLSEARHALPNSIHPLFQRDQWVTEETMPKHKGATPTLGEHDGLWLVWVPIGQMLGPFSAISNC